jgi:hypothetical protein
MKGGVKMAAEKQIPTGVKIISILYYIGAVLGVIIGLLFIVAAGMMASFADQIPLIGSLGTGLFIVGGIILIGLGVLGFFIGKGLWKLKSWARITAIVFACLGVLSALTSMFQGDFSGNIFGLVFNGVIGWYLLLNKEAKQAFA